MAVTVNQAVDNYLTDLALEGKSPETILWHRKKLSAFCQFLQNGGDPLRVSDLTLENGRAFVKGLMDRKTRYGAHVIRKEVEGGLAPQTVHGFVRSIRTFASWLQREGYSEEHVFQGLKPLSLVPRPLNFAGFGRQLHCRPPQFNCGGNYASRAVLSVEPSRPSPHLAPEERCDECNRFLPDNPAQVGRANKFQSARKGYGFFISIGKYTN